MDIYDAIKDFIESNETMLVLFEETDPQGNVVKSKVYEARNSTVIVEAR